jgi:mono/diheme cytochrome c family protein
LAVGKSRDYLRQTVVAIVLSLLSLLTLVLPAAVLSGCDRPPDADRLPEWTPSDHHSSDEDKLAAKRGTQTAGGATGDEVTRLVDLAWRQQCATCHGATGKGDGQFGPMVKAPDLTRDDWQERVSDAEIATIIKKGKGKMPSFDVPDSVVQGLVARVRAARGR